MMNQKARELMIMLTNQGASCSLISSKTSTYISVNGHMVRISDHKGHSKFKGTQIRKDGWYEKTKYGMIFGYGDIKMAVSYIMDTINKSNNED